MPWIWLVYFVIALFLHYFSLCILLKHDCSYYKGLKIHKGRNCKPSAACVALVIVISLAFLSYTQSGLHTWSHDFSVCVSLNSDLGSWLNRFFTHKAFLHPRRTQRAGSDMAARSKQRVSLHVGTHHTFLQGFLVVAESYQVSLAGHVTAVDNGRQI